MKSMEDVELPIGGMTCAACARTVELQLAHSPGVGTASVNFATRTASVSFNPAQTGVEKLVAAVEEVGYDVPLQSQEIAQAAEARALRTHLIVAAIFAVPVFVLQHRIHEPLSSAVSCFAFCIVFSLGTLFCLITLTQVPYIQTSNRTSGGP